MAPIKVSRLVTHLFRQNEHSTELLNKRKKSFGGELILKLTTTTTSPSMDSRQQKPSRLHGRPAQSAHHHQIIILMQIPEIDKKHTVSVITEQAGVHAEDF